AEEAILRLLGARDEGDREVGAGGEAVFAAQDADDGARRAVDADGPADDPRVGAEVLPPDLLRQNDDVVASRLALFRHEAAAEEWAGAEGREEVGRHPVAPRLERAGAVGAVVGEGVAAEGAGGEGLEGAEFALPGAEVLPGDGAADPALAGHVVDVD